MYQQILIMGNLGKDPVLKQNSAGKDFTELSVAVGKKWKDKDGKEQEKTTWFNVHVREGQAKSCAQYLKKGSKVFVEAEYETYSYEKDGETKYHSLFKANRVVFLTPKREESSGGNYTPDDIDF